MPKLVEKRTKNYTEREKSDLIDCVEPFLEIIENPLTNRETNELKEQTWNQIADNFNETHEIPRQGMSLRMLYMNLKKYYKKQKGAIDVSFF